MAMQTFLSAVPIPPEQVHRVHGEYDDCVRAADAYEAALKAVFDLDDEQIPCFDLIVLGLGEDGHIASLLPGDPAVSAADHLTWPVYHETRHNRVTLTAPVLQNARHMIVLVSGAAKAEIVRSLFSSPPDVQRYPAYVLWPSLDKTVWLVDEAAAALL
jgi:6-phosphogluconolactonase